MIQGVYLLIKFEINASCFHLSLLCFLFISTATVKSKIFISVFSNCVISTQISAQTTGINK